PQNTPIHHFLNFSLVIPQGSSMGNKLVASGMAQMVRTAAQGSVAGLAPTGVQIPAGLQVSPLDPGNYTIQFTVLPPADGLGFAAYAIVNWKTAGHQLTRKVSVFSGAVLSGVCDSVDIFIVDVSQIGVAGFPPIQPTTILGTIPLSTASLYGAGGSLAGATLTLNIGGGPSTLTMPVGGYVNVAALLAGINAQWPNTASSSNGFLLLQGQPLTLGSGTANTLLGLSGMNSTTVPVTYQVGISLSKGTRAANMQPATLMTQLSALPIIPNSDSNFTIPSDAGVISALVTAARQSNNSGIGSGGVIIPTDVFARQYSQGSIVLNTWYPIAQSPGWVPIAGNAVSV